MAHSLPNLSQLDFQNKTVLLRVDFNVPMQGEEITDDTRIRAALPTIRRLRDGGARVVICSHLGRPKGKTPEFSLLPVAERLAHLLGGDGSGDEVVFSHDTVGDDVAALVLELPERGVMLLENLRYDVREQAGDEDFARKLAALADVFVNDAFGAMHRPDASIVGVPTFLPSAVGPLVEAEIHALGTAIARPERPFGAILGGAKVSEKMGVIRALAHKVDHLFIGGAMAYTLLAAQGIQTGKSRVEADKLDLARELLDLLHAKGVALHLPSDHIVATEFSEKAEGTVVTDIPPDKMGLDIGPQTIAEWSVLFQKCRTLFWNGPLGVFEWDAYAAGTRGVAGAFARSGAFTIVGGGDSAAAIAKFGLTGAVRHVSTGGGASLEFIEEGDLVGLAALRKRG